nr:hypothetical protein [Oscillospiraceae bacterium]
LATAWITAFGNGGEKLSTVNLDRMRTSCEEKTDDHAYYEGMSQWLDQLAHMQRTGRVPRPVTYWLMVCAISALAGAVFGGVALGIARVRMAPPREKREADEYIDPDGSRIRDAGRYFLYTSTARRYDPPQKKSSGSGRSGGSSFSHSYSGSSGSSHSGSGRRF